jgi:hypothetical protein
MNNNICVSANRRSEMSVKRSCKPVMVILRKGQISAAKINSLCVATGELYGFFGISKLE